MNQGRGPRDDHRGRNRKPTGAKRGGRPSQRRAQPERPARTEDQQIYDGPPIPDDVSAKDLDKQARQALQSLPEKLAERVSRHLVMAGLLMHDDPETAYQHALAARARASRNGLIREACGETAYAAGKFADALSEFRAARRMNGQQHYAPMMADCERALGRPEKALAYDTPELRSKLDEAGQIELSIVIAGARRDLGQVEAALRLLETEPLHSKSRADWVARLRYAYADTLLDAGRREDAIEWFHRVVAVDGNKATDAEDRLAALS
jgi:tetratricopeptide (TPR) repeat protein